MKPLLFGFTFAIALLPVPVEAGDIAVIGEPLKDAYKLSGPGYSEFFKTEKVANSYSMICDMGQALPDEAQGKGWYKNQPIPGLRLELRARLVTETSSGYKPTGFVVIVKNGDVLVSFKPIGDMVEGIWQGDAFSSWSGTSTDVDVYSERFGRSGYAYFDLIDGNGFYYKKAESDSPDYFLYNCRRIKKQGLPVYTWRGVNAEQY